MWGRGENMKRKDVTIYDLNKAAPKITMSTSYDNFREREWCNRKQYIFTNETRYHGSEKSYEQAPSMDPKRVMSKNAWK
jgi:hypothetical protein